MPRKDLERSALMMAKIKNPQKNLKELSNLSSADHQSVMSGFTDKIKSGMTNIINDGIKEHTMSDRSDFTTDLRQTSQEKSDSYNKYITGKNAPYNKEKSIPGYSKK
jgi:hypothetical protein